MGAFSGPSPSARQATARRERSLSMRRETFTLRPTTSTTYRSEAKLRDDSVAAWLDGSAPAPEKVVKTPALDEQLRAQDRVAQAMRQVRLHHGALSLRTPQAEAVFRGGELADLRPDEPNRAKELIEDLMVAVNGVTARYFASKGLPSLRRVLRSPERWGRIVALARALGETLPALPSGEGLQLFLTKRRLADAERFPELSLSVVKLLGRGEYVLEVPGQETEGHFGLAVRDYTQSTAPNRRFPDLVTQRLLKAAIEGEPPAYSSEELGLLARHCTEQEANAEKVERQVAKSAAALLLRIANRRAIRGPRNGCFGEGHVGTNRPSGHRGKGRARIRGSRCRRSHSSGTGPRRRRARLHRLRPSGRLVSSKPSPTGN